MAQQRLKPPALKHLQSSTYGSLNENQKEVCSLSMYGRFTGTFETTATVISRSLVGILFCL